MTHSAQIINLRLTPHGSIFAQDSLIGELTKLSWPMLRKFTANADSVPLAESLPHLQKLALSVFSVAQFMELSDRLLTALWELEVGEVTSAFLTHLSKFPRLQVLKTFADEDLWHRHRDFLSRVAVYDFVHRNGWHVLRRCPKLKLLAIQHSTCPAMPTPEPLPHLKHVCIGDDTEPRFEIGMAFLLAHAVLTSQPHLKNLYLRIQKPSEEAMEEIVKRTEQLISVAMARNVRRLNINVDGRALRAVMDLPAVKYGWLDIVCDE